MPVMALNVAVLLFVFYWLDRRAYRKDIAEGCKPDISKPGTEIRILGLHNLIFLVMIVAAVILSGVLPGMADVYKRQKAYRASDLHTDICNPHAREKGEQPAKGLFSLFSADNK